MPRKPASKALVTRTKDYPDGDEYNYVFPAIQSIQSGRLYWTASVPVKLLKKLFVLEKPTGLDPMEWHQRALSLSRVKALKKYILETPGGYSFSAITATIEADVEFVELHPDNPDIGKLKIPMDGVCYIVDGQHRCSALRAAVESDPTGDLKDESISVVFFLDIGGKRRKQLFIDLNLGAKPSKSVMSRLDQRDAAAIATQAMLEQVEFYKWNTDLERTTLTSTNTKLFTLNSLRDANAALLKSTALLEEENPTAKVVEFWKTLLRRMPDWHRYYHDTSVLKSPSAHQIREETLSTQAITIVALGQLGAEILGQNLWQLKLQGLERIDWTRTNPDWEGVCTMNYRIVKNGATTRAMKEYIQKFLLTDEEVAPKEEPQPVA